MRVIARGTLTGFVRYRVQPGEREVLSRHLNTWFTVINKATWTSSAELKRDLRSASIISARRCVFNIQGNHFRLIADISYEHQVLFIKWLGTHKEYDKIDVLSVEYNKERYANSSDSK